MWFNYLLSNYSISLTLRKYSHSEQFLMYKDEHHKICNSEETINPLYVPSKFTTYMKILTMKYNIINKA